MLLEIKVPSPGESISEVEIAKWFINDGDYVSKEQEIAEIESEKATLPLIAPASGKLTIIKSAGSEVPVGEVVCVIDTSQADPGKNKPSEKTKEVKAEKEKAGKTENIEAEITPLTEKLTGKSQTKTGFEDIRITPVAQKMMDEHHLSVEDIINGLRKLSSKEVSSVMGAMKEVNREHFVKREYSRGEERLRMSVLRRKLSQRLVNVKNETAMLTTFNEADMSVILGLRKKYQERFIKKHGIKLGLMSFFTKAVSEALMLFPNLNSHIEGEEIVVPAFTDIGIAVQTDKGLMVPVIRNTESMKLSEIEIKLSELATKAKSNRISIEEMNGGTFTITNGGVYGSMLSTPILNPPQSGILGMHNIIERPVVIDGQIVIRPMMYLALSYDHRIVDGKDSVSFLAKVREFVENPERMLITGSDPEKFLLDL